ncbi:MULTISPECIES: precorrin-6A synthase (deacetylating) [Pseudomonas]|jgi:precorrin-6A synthase|uniref:Precorrin-6A synthase (Deacetylating) n=1 Tax=Pseudomonas gingeri TaxID=117681 RepID=A0A7Y8BIP6_9PSED|nr:MULTISPECIES: precorrin-6A synthase (deacetylating) [Pseudomonas]MCU1740990.1 precorrin-6A synthase (deacetylating) [Pseudomonas sp. 20S_6.2_Bac1]NWB45221.1 precorrin-6A synthase (deacetylating) [Pseudomonas gingeri]
MKTLLLIGMGPGHPEQITVQAINALNRASVLFLLDKGEAKDDLLNLRKDICERYIQQPGCRQVQVSDPVREDSAASYEAGVEHWHRQRAALFARLIDEELGEDESGAFLVWGDPGLYDSTLRILERVRALGGPAFAVEVIPGISSIQVLAAQHRIPLNRIGEPLLITTGRRLEAANLDNVVVMLDARCAFGQFADQDLEIYWGAYLGTEDELLVAGKLHEVGERIRRVREAARKRKGWIMDCYLLRRPLKS